MGVNREHFIEFALTKRTGARAVLRLRTLGETPKHVTDAFPLSDQDNEGGWGTEIDVFEIGGKAKGFEYKHNMNVHVFRTPQEEKHWSVGGVWVAPWRLADDYHVYGLEWNKDEIKYFADGVLVRSVENTHWRQPLYLIFDSETMPKWFGMPEDKDLPSTFSVEYVRAWKKK